VRHGFATRSNSSGSTGGRIKYLAAVIFFPLLWLRGFVIAVGRAISGLCTISGIIAAGVAALTRYHCWAIAGGPILAGFLGFMFLQFYDSILVRLNPTGRTFLFYQ
jgi:hypothetical protein